MASLSHQLASFWAAVLYYGVVQSFEPRVFAEVLSLLYQIEQTGQMLVQTRPEVLNRFSEVVDGSEVHCVVLRLEALLQQRCIGFYDLGQHRVIFGHLLVRVKEHATIGNKGDCLLWLDERFFDYYLFL